MSTPTETALARRWRLDVNMGSPDYQLCPAITNFQWEAPPNIEDSSTYDDEGWSDSEKTGQSWSATATFNRKASPDSTTYSPVHEALRQAAFGWGDDAKVDVRFYDRNGLPEAYQGYALVTWAPSGGERTALDQVEVTLTGKGPLTPITNPVTP
ncbi:hypothetical protein ABZ883_14925 [Streptomyces sp. NPDC046977]|uniref:phage tail tube protein n=1 Tax=Streptomyces sp. NPDC046977 TaxID=3154703 RepID=UPI0033CEDD94